MDSYYLLLAKFQKSEKFFKWLKYTQYLDFYLSNNKLYFFLFKTHRH